MADGQTKKQKRIILWGTPRSLSTAMFRAMYNRKTCKCTPEPYAMAFFFGPERVLNWYPEVPLIDGFDFKSVKKEIYEAEYEESEVFMKDFPMYIYNQKLHNPDDLIPKGYLNTFLIRPPRECIESGWRVFQKKSVSGWTEWNRDMIGFKGLWEFYNLVKQTQPDPLIIHSHDLMANPEGTMRLYCERTGLEYTDSMVNWDENDGLEAKMESAFPFLKPFVETVVGTKKIHPSHSIPKSKVDLPPELEKDIEENNIYYEKLLQFTTRVPPATK